MYKLKKSYDNRNDEDVEDICTLLEANVDCTNKLIKHIDNLIEKKYFSEPIYKILISLRDTCAVNAMNIVKFIK